jgi:flagellar basal-body rod modification protein FlgD
MNKIDPSLYLTNQQQTREPSPVLDRDGFLKILMTQLQNQDPGETLETTEMINQMTNLSSLEQMMKMSESIDTLVQSQLISPVIEYSHMIGKQVSYDVLDEETGSKVGAETSEVIAVSQEDGWAVLELKNGEKVHADAVIQVSNDPVEENEESS